MNKPQRPKIIRRELNGIVLLDKPTGVSSNDVLQRVRRLFRAKKAGHTGSLDPLATGMLPICFGEATKLCHYLLEADKTYYVTAQLGVRTTTSDSEGEVVAQKDVPALSESAINATLDTFRGELMQVPSMFSALKYQGQPLYKLARQGITVERPARAITVYRNHIVDWNDELNQLSLEITCSKGTYIRTIIDDLGELLGCGAHVVVLRRTSVAGFDQQQMHEMSVLESAHEQGEVVLDPYMLPMSTALQHWPCVQLTAELGLRLRHGQSVCVSEFKSEADHVRVLDESGDFIAVAQPESDGLIKPIRILKPIVQ